MKKPLILLLTVLVAATMLIGCAPGDITDTVYLNISYPTPYWDEITVPANAVAGGWPAPTTGNVQSGFVYLFADETVVNEKYVHFTIQMPHSWKEGTSIIPNVRYVFRTDEVGTCVRWRISYSWANIGDPFPVATNVWALSDPTNNDGIKHIDTKFAPVSGAGKKIGSVLLCFLSRNSSDVSDNYTDVAEFVAVSVAYQIDAPGSDGAWSK